MPWSGASGSQTYTRSDGTRSGTDVYAQQKAAGIDIVAAQHDATEQDLATAVNLTLKKDGGNKPTADIDWGGFKITNLAAPTLANDAVRKAYVEDHLILVTSELTIAGGSVTATKSRHTIDTESDAATDNLNNIVTTNLEDGSLLLLYQENSARVVTVFNGQLGAGQIHTKGNRNILLSTENPLVLQRIGADWYEVIAPLSGGDLLATASASNDASIDFTQGDWTVYKRIELHFQNVIPATDSVDAWIRIADTGSTFLTTPNYRYVYRNVSDGAGEGTGNSMGDSKWKIMNGIGSDTNERGIAGRVILHDPLDSGRTLVDWKLVNQDTSSGTQSVFGAGAEMALLTVEAVQFLFSSGNVESGEFQLWGYR